MKLSLEEKVKYVLQYNGGEVIKTPDVAKSHLKIGPLGYFYFI